VDKELTTEEKIDLAIATAYTKALQASWKECLDRAAAVTLQAAFEKQAKEKNNA
jgi:hypothetical protein